MSQSVSEKAVCEECGVDTRENTLFCFNCGTRIVEPEHGTELSTDTKVMGDDPASDPMGKPETRLETPVGNEVKPEAEAALEDLANRIRIEPAATDEKATSLAAAKRKKARQSKRKGSEYVWEPVEDPPGRLMLVIVALFTLLAVAAVVVTLIWK